jgi:hypothetical protein
MASASDFKFDDRSVPLAYEELFVPRFFTQFGGDLLSRTGVAVGERSSMSQPARARWRAWRRYESVPEGE